MVSDAASWIVDIFRVLKHGPFPFFAIEYSYIEGQED